MPRVTVRVDARYGAAFDRICQIEGVTAQAMFSAHLDLAVGEWRKRGRQPATEWQDFLGEEASRAVDDTRKMLHERRETRRYAVEMTEEDQADLTAAARQIKLNAGGLLSGIVVAWVTTYRDGDSHQVAEWPAGPSRDMAMAIVGRAREIAAERRRR